MKKKKSTQYGYFTHEFQNGFIIFSFIIQFHDFIMSIMNMFRKHVMLHWEIRKFVNAVG